MRTTGIVRRIDDLGRFAIPKEILRAAKCAENDAMEIYYSPTGEIALKKYRAIEEYIKYFQAARKALNAFGICSAFYSPDGFAYGDSALSNMPIEHMMGYQSGMIKGNCYIRLELEGEVIGFIVYADTKAHSLVVMACNTVRECIKANI